LEEDEYAMAGGKELGQDPVEELDLARCANEFIIDEAGGVDLVFDALEEEGMLADLTELHKLVAETLDTCRFTGGILAPATEEQLL
jgi:hypothetical protein